MQDPEGQYMFTDKGGKFYRSPTGQSRRVHAEFGFEAFEVGGSRFYPGVDVRKLKNAAHYYGKARGMKFSIRATQDGAHCLRVA